MKTMHWFLAGLILIGSTNAAFAQDAAPEVSPSDRIVRSFADCTAIAAADARLQCFDKAAASLSTALANQEVRIVDRSDVRKTQRSLFGFALPSLRLFGGGDREEGFTEIRTTVASAHAVANNRAEIRLADESGAVWQTTDPVNFPPRPGAEIRIRKGAMGNYFIAVDGRTYRGTRLR